MGTFMIVEASLLGMNALRQPFSYYTNRNIRFNFKKIESLRIFCDHSCFECLVQGIVCKIRHKQISLMLHASRNVRNLSYRPPGTQLYLLNDVSFSLTKRSFGLIFGRSGSGKTTLLQLIAGLNQPTSGCIVVQRYGDDGLPNQLAESLLPEKVGIVFQFPERYFLADTVLEEVAFGWPKQMGGLQLKEHFASNLRRALKWVGLEGIPFDKDPHSLSGGYKRRLALAIQLVQVPELLILDEPLAGLDWKARADVAKLLKHLKRELTLLVVSHDLKELAFLVDQSWRMEVGGILKEEPIPL